jgi:hypothetical protein
MQRPDPGRQCQRNLTPIIHLPHALYAPLGQNPKLPQYSTFPKNLLSFLDPPWAVSYGLKQIGFCDCASVGCWSTRLAGGPAP